MSQELFHFTDDQIESILEQNISESMQDHLQTCQYCASRVQDARRFEDTLRAMMYRSECPSAETITNYHLGEISIEEQRALRRHLDICPACREELAATEAFFREESVFELPAVPQPAPRRSNAPTPRRTPLLRAAPVAMAGVRGDTRGGAQLMAFGTTTSVLIEQQAVDADRVRLTGQILDDELDPWVGALVEAQSAGHPPVATTVDDLGTFVCVVWRSNPVAVYLFSIPDEELMLNIAIDDLN